MFKEAWSKGLLAAAACLAVVAARAVDIEPARIQLVDRFGVNMANGQVTNTLNTVSIGGAMGLSHSISVDANEFGYLNYRGFRDKFFGRAVNAVLTSDPAYSPMEVLRVHDFAGSADFAYYVGSALQPNGSSLTTSYNYRSIGDERQILEYDANYLYWTKPDGTVVRYMRTGSPQSAASGAVLYDITYPNGLIITVTSAGMSVNTNTGFQLKAVYVADNRPLPPDKVALDVGLVNAPPASSAGWAVSNPKYIYGVNNAVEFCAPAATSCSFSKTWPYATFNWPAGMPRTMYLGISDVSVTDSRGATTTYSYRAFDLAYNEGSIANRGAVVPGHIPNTDFSPRLVGVSPPNSTQQLSYDYKNIWINAQSVERAFDMRLSRSGMIKSATRRGATVYYEMLAPFAYGSDLQSQEATSINGLWHVHLRGNVVGAVGALNEVRTHDGNLFFENNARNFVWRIENKSSGAPREDYTYDPAYRGNLTRISYNNLDSTVTATYPATCSNRKTCNHATSITDARGKTTHYEYHPESGQLAKVTYPPNQHGVRAETRYTYSLLFAKYYTSPGVKVSSTKGIWMKTAEKYCIRSAATNGTCADANDDVVTTYEYNNDNLLLTGMTVTDPTSGKTLRTCYQHDIYGNQAGSTEPNANLTSCTEFGP